MKNIDKHHLLFGRRRWATESNAHKEARQEPAYQVRMDRDWHDVLHRVVDVVPIPSIEVADALVDFGREMAAYDDNSRIAHLLDNMAGFVIGHRSPEQAMEMRFVMGSLAAQQGVMELSRSMRPQL